MKIKNITYPTPLNQVKDISNDNIDVFIETEDGRNYTVTVCTPKFYCSSMEKENQDFIPAGCPNVIVKELTESTIRKAIETYCEYDAYWLKVYHLAGVNREVFSIESMDKMMDDMEKDFE